jgi:hypothetical protein
LPAAVVRRGLAAVPPQVSTLAAAPLPPPLLRVPRFSCRRPPPAAMPPPPQWPPQWRPPDPQADERKAAHATTKKPSGSGRDSGRCLWNLTCPRSPTVQNRKFLEGVEPVRLSPGPLFPGMWLVALLLPLGRPHPTGGRGFRTETPMQHAIFWPSRRKFSRVTPDQRPSSVGHDAQLCTRQNRGEVNASPPEQAALRILLLETHTIGGV